MIYMIFAVIGIIGIMNIHYDPVRIDILEMVRLEGVALMGVVLVYVMILMVYTLERGDKFSLFLGSKNISRVVKAKFWIELLGSERGIIRRILRRCTQYLIRERLLYDKIIKSKKGCREKERMLILREMGIRYEEEGDIIRLRRLYGIKKRLRGEGKIINEYRWLRGMMKVTTIGIWFKDTFRLMGMEVGVLPMKWLDFRERLLKLRRSLVGGIVISGICSYYKLYNYVKIDGDMARVCYKLAGLVMMVRLVFNVMELLIGVVYSIIITMEFRKYGKGRRGLNNKEGRRALMGIIIKNTSSITAILMIKEYVGI